MNKVQIIIIALLAATAGFLGAWFLTGQTGGESPETGEPEREILYWVAPMDANYRRDEPGKSPMGMDLVPVYADEAGQTADSEPSIRINPAVINNIGVKTAPVERRDINRDIEAVGLVTPDEGKISHVHVRTEGWIEELHVETQGDRVTAGDPLFEIYSPALVSAQEEYLQATRTGNRSLLRASQIRLAALGMSDEQVEALRRRGSSTRRFTVQAPRDGYVIELNVRQGMYVQPGNTIISIADLTGVWVEVDLFEGQIAWVDTGQKAAMTLPFSATDREWDGKVDYVYPTMRAETRTGRVRLAFDNPDLALKPNMYASVEIAADPRREALVIPAQSIIRTGDGKRVILALGDGRFRPAEVETGLEVDGMTEIVAGLDKGEQIVVSGQFLLDSEASVDAGLLRMIGDSGDHGETEHEMDHGDMDHGDMNHGDMDHANMEQETMDNETMNHEGMDSGTMDHGDMDHEAMNHEAMNHEAMNHEAMDQEDMNHGDMDHGNDSDTVSEDDDTGGEQ